MVNRQIIVYSILGLMIVIMFQGCYAVSIKRIPPKYTARPEKLPIKVGVYLDDKVRNYAIPGQVENKVLVGEALNNEVVASLKEVFPEGSLFYNKNMKPQDIAIIIAIEFGSKTKIEFEVFNEVRSITELVCKIYDKEWNLLWEETVIGNAAAPLPKPSFGFGGAYGGARAGEIGLQSMKIAAINSLALALDLLNYRILASGKDAILKGK
jgi:hypothetical protein